MDFRQTTFMLSVAALKQLPKDEGAEVAFIGCSNAGKSSAINALTGIKSLTRTSKTPGRTQQMNFFALGEGQRLVDLPGYGFAKVPLATKANWERLVNRYLQTRTSLKGLVVIMDIRHPLKPADEHLLEWAVTCGLDVHVLLNKADKLAYGARVEQTRDVSKQLAAIGPGITAQAFSALKAMGVDTLSARIEGWVG